MTRVVFLRAGQTLLGYDISGHSGAGVAGEDVVCAAISSAAYLVANTITEVCAIAAETAATDGHMTVPGWTKRMPPDANRFCKGCSCTWNNWNNNIPTIFR